MEGVANRLTSVIKCISKLSLKTSVQCNCKQLEIKLHVENQLISQTDLFFGSSATEFTKLLRIFLTFSRNIFICLKTLEVAENFGKLKVVV